MTDPSKWIEYLKLHPKYVLPIFVFCLFLLCAPISVLSILGLEKVLEEYRVVPGIILMLSASMLLVHLILKTYTSSQKQLRRRRERSRRRRVLTSLSPAEKTLLRAYMQQETKTMDLSLQDGVARNLEATGVLVRVSTLAVGFDFSTPFNLQPWAWDELRENPGLLE